MFEKIYIKGSSFINKICFENNEVEITMGSGKSYTYKIKTETFIEFLLSDSKGKFYNQNIKNKKAM